jgi:hypothetical protein
MTDPDEGYKKYWLGLHKFTEKSIGKQALNTLGHAGIGLGTAAPYCAVACWLFALPLWPAFPISTIGLIIREAVQLAKSDSPHLLDRARDIIDGIWGGLIAYCIFKWAIPACSLHVVAC